VHKFNLFLTGFIAGAATLYVANEIRFHKRNLISEDRLATIEKIETKMEELAKDDNVSPEEFSHLWEQETTFIEIITNTDVI